MSDLTTEWRGHVAIVSLNRPQKANAIDWTMFDEFPRVVREVSNDERTRVIVFRGEGRSFCGGPDLSKDTRLDSHAVLERNPEVQRQYYRRWGNFVSPIVHAEQPTVALIQGWAAGEGWSIAAHCDFRIGCETAKFKTDINRVGGLDVVGLLWALAQAMGSSRASEVYLLGRTLDAEEALRLGVLTRLVSQDRLLEDGLAFAAELAQLPPISTKLQKHLLRNSLIEEFDRYLARVSMMAANVELSDDHQQAFRAYEEGRPLPDFRGR
jgi:2-(1,2-epoxy-1,2-dihydrophenyl)acetyl-CoA isomerase